MVTIKEAELLTGITRQNIRYYEKMGLIHPSREKENQYRKYNKEDIRRLKLIYMFRKLDMPLEEIQQILDGRKDLQEALEQQKEQLRQKRQKLEAALSFCGEIQETELTDLNVDLYLQKMEAKEKQGNKFADILDDYKKVVESESIRTFSFSPDDFCTTPRQMTEQLFRYAQRNHLDLVITKEGLCPEFTIDGKEYHAYRICGRLGMVIRAELMHPESCVPEGMSSKRYKILRKISQILIPLCLLLMIMLPTILQIRGDNHLEVIASVLGILGMLAYIIYYAILYKNYRE